MTIREELSVADINEADPVQVIARAIEQCDYDFRSVARVSQWSFSRAAYILAELEKAGLTINDLPYQKTED